MQYLGDYAEDYATLNFKFSTHKADGTPATLSGTPAISVYKANGTTQSTAGITLTADFDSVTGLNNVLIDLSADAFYAVANDYSVVITTGTVDSVSVVGTVLAHFSIENRFNEVDVTKISGDSTAADNLESACDNYSATRGLAGTALPAAAADTAGGLPISDAGGLDLDTLLSTLTNGTYGLSAIETLVDELESRLTATRAGYLDNLSGGAVALASGVTVSTNNDKTGYSLSASGVTAVQNGLSTLTAQQVWEYTTRTLSAFGFSVTVGTNSDKTGYSLTATPPTAAQIADAVLDETLSDHLTSGSVGAGINAAGSAGDPWNTVLPGAYGAGTAGKIIGDNVNATISSRSTLTAQQVWEYATRTLSSFGSLVSDVATAVWGAVARTITGGTVDTCTTNTDMRGTNGALLAANYTAPNNSGITDIKAKTDQLTFTEANKVDATATVSVAGLATEAKQDEIIADIAGVITHGDANWLTPSGIGGTIAITFNVKDDSGNNILDAVVEVWDTAGTTLKERKETNSSGNAIFNCKAETYTIKITKSGYSFDNASYTVTVPATVNYVMTAFVIPVSPDLTKCRVWMKLVNTYTSLTVTAEVPENLAGNNLVMGSYTGVYDTVNNLVYWDIPIGAVNSVLKITELGFEVVVPLILDLDESELEDLI